jgi:hypothetical protein
MDGLLFDSLFKSYACWYWYTTPDEESVNKLELHCLSGTVYKNATINTVHEKWKNMVVKVRSGSIVR